MKQKRVLLPILLVAISFSVSFLLLLTKNPSRSAIKGKSVYAENASFWFILKRNSQKEILYHGEPGNLSNSVVVREFDVRVGDKDTPTPLPQKLGKNYWVIEEKYKTDNERTGPYFLKLNIDAPDSEPYGPEPYLECGGKQCNWQEPGPFGLHGVGNDESRLDKSKTGSFGCIRHKNEDITFLYDVIKTDREVRYYIEET